MGQFARDVKDFEIKVNRMGPEIIKKVVFEMYIRVVLRTRFDTGRARGNWMIAVGSPATGTTSRTARGGPVSSELASLGSYDGKSAIWLTNNLNYIGYLEYGTQSRQGDHMLERTVREFQSIVRSLS